jgi:DHA2 family multidrug resistance protein
MTGGALVFFWRALSRDEPIVDLGAFRDRNFAFGSLFSFVLGVGLYGLTYLYPLFLGRIRGYDSLMIGHTMFVSGLAMFFTAPVVGILSRKVDLRILMLVGFLGFALSTWMLTGLTSDWDFWELLVPQVLRGMSLMMCMVPINNLALGTLPPERLKNASGLYNLTRNLGGAVGLALINTVLANRGALHYERLAETVNWSNPEVMAQMDAMQRALAAKGLDGQRGALQQMIGQITQQATVMSFIDVFTILAALFASLAVLILALKKPAPRGGPAAAH